MLSKYKFLVILLTLSVSYAEYDNDYNNVEETVHEGSPCEVKIAASLTVMKNEINRKLDTIVKNIPDILEIYLDNKFNVLEKNYNEKLHKLEKNIQDSLETYIDDKFESLEKHIYRKIDALEKIVPDKTDTNLIGYKLDALKKLHLESDESAIYALTNKTSKKIEEDIQKNLILIEQTMVRVENATTNINLDSLDQNLENKLNQQWTELNKVLPKIEENIEHKLNALGKKVPEHFEENINLKLVTMEKNIISLNENTLRRLDILDKKFEQNIDNKFAEMEKTIPELKQNMNNRMDALQNLEKNVLTEVHKSWDNLGCKVQRVTGNHFAMPCHRMDEESLTHVSYRNDSAGLSYFEMHLAVKGDGNAHVLLSPAEIYDVAKDIGFEIGIFPESNVMHIFRMTKDVVTLKISDILSTNRFTAFYVKIRNGTLEVGKEGKSSPLISYSDPDLKKVKYFSFGSATISGERTFLYDCPPNVFQLLFNER